MKAKVNREYVNNETARFEYCIVGCSNSTASSFRCIEIVTVQVFARAISSVHSMSCQITLMSNSRPLSHEP